MKTRDSFILSEISDVRDVVRIACAVESAERGVLLDPHDPRVQIRAADIILNGVGAQLRAVRSGQASMR
ncbi:MAG TPA: hypothetical protein VFG14_07550 [Chthoniobacteraceae bacterium]|nr:hypothetical protein [Chthoniobacteraceae bacterium]